MEIIEQFKKYKIELDKIDGILQKKNKERLLWCEDNRKEIKKLYPKKNVIYKVTNVYEAIDSYYHEQLINPDEDYFFRSKHPMFIPYNCFKQWGWKSTFPTCKGEILDSNFNFVCEVDLPITLFTIPEQDDAKNNQNKITKVYVMIDKNTGFYKIGRSKNPKTREKTLQSEKPTIEMLFNYDARVKDEKELHKMFSNKRVRGEWFDLNGSDLMTIKEYFND